MPRVGRRRRALPASWSRCSSGSAVPARPGGSSGRRSSLLMLRARPSADDDDASRSTRPPVRRARRACYVRPHVRPRADPDPAMSDRPSWDQYFMTITRQVAERSTCTRAKVGAVIVRDKNILATGYNGSPAGLPHCLDVGCLVYRSTHAAGRDRGELLPHHPRRDQRDRAGGEERRRHPRRGHLHHPHAVHPLLQGARSTPASGASSTSASTSCTRSRSCCGYTDVALAQADRRRD